ncbi:MAG: tetratricopeptide repeat protein [Magnetococcus sp. DMHC-6]
MIYKNYRFYRGIGWFLLAILASCQTVPQPEANLEDFKIQLDKGEAYLAKGNAVMALPSLNNALKYQPNNVKILTLLGIAYDQTDRHAQSLAVMKKAHELKPEDGQINNNLGVSLMRMGELDTAEIHFKSALTDLTYATPEDAWLNLALLYKRRGDGTKKMVEALDNALKYKPSHLPAIMELADVYNKQQQYELEIKMLLEAQNLAPDNLTIMKKLADSYIQSENFQQARSILKKIVAQSPLSEIGKWAASQLATSK